jgi:hypothetical protein
MITVSTNPEYYGPDATEEDGQRAASVMAARLRQRGWRVRLDSGQPSHPPEAEDDINAAWGAAIDFVGAS